MNSLLEQAREYRSYGWSVIPVKAESKLPSISWKKYQTEYATDQELESWFDGKSQEDVGIGLVTGRLSGIVVIDLDSYKENATVMEVKTPVKVKTGGGGTHGYFKYKEGVRNTVGIQKATDIRGEGGYVVLPPSKHPSGGYYEWISKDIKNLPELPNSFTSNWQEVKEPIHLTDLTSKGQGERNDSLYRAACSLLSKHDESEAWELVNDLNRTYDPPLTEHEVKTLFGSAYKYIKQDLVENEQRGDGLLLGEPITWAKIREDNIKRDWLWENFIAKGNITLFSALAKAGKTTLLRCLFVAMKNKEEFAGQPTSPCRVLILSEESASEWADGREGIDDGDIDHVYIWPRPTRGIPSSKEWVEIIDITSKKCKELSVDMVVVDTISTFWPVDDENDAAKVKKALVPLYKLTDDAGVALVLVHHFKKDGGKEGTASRGSGALAGHVDNIIEFRRNEDGYPNQRKLKTMGRFIQETELIIELTNDGKYETKGEPWVVSKKARMSKILSLMEESDRSMSIQEITSLWNSRLNKISNKTIGRYVKELIHLGQCTLDREETVQGKMIPFYTVTGWKESSENTLDNKNTYTTGAVQGDVIVQATVQANKKQAQELPWTATVVTEREIVQGKDYGTKEIPFIDDEDGEPMPF